MDVLIAAALALWLSVGSFLAPSIVGVDGDVDPDSTAQHTYVGEAIWIGAVCQVTVWHSAYDLFSPAEQQTIVDHEVGHCLGLRHIPEEGIMHAVIGDALTGADVAEFQRAQLSHHAFTVIAHD